jgi:hypothetical protein
MECLRERRLAFRRKNTVKDKFLSSHLPDYVPPPSHPVHFQDRKFFFL